MNDDKMWKFNELYLGVRNTKRVFDYNQFVSDYNFYLTLFLCSDPKSDTFHNMELLDFAVEGFSFGQEQIYGKLELNDQEIENELLMQYQNIVDKNKGKPVEDLGVKGILFATTFSCLNICLEMGLLEEYGEVMADLTHNLYFITKTLSSERKPLEKTS